MVTKHLRMSKWADRLRKVEQLAQSFQLYPLATRYKPRLCQPSSVWKLFPRQNMAFSFAQSCKEVTQDFADAGLSQQSVPQIWHLCLTFYRPCTFLHLKKKRHLLAKGSTWLPVTASSGITTGNCQLYITKLGVYYFVFWRRCNDVRWW